MDLEVRRGFHVYANPSGDANLAPTALSPVLGRLVEVRYPEGEAGPAGVRLYRGRVRIEGRVAMPRTGAPSVELSYQACDEGRCLPSDHPPRAALESGTSPGPLRDLG